MRRLAELLFDRLQERVEVGNGRRPLVTGKLELKIGVGAARPALDVIAQVMRRRHGRNLLTDGQRFRNRAIFQNRVNGRIIHRQRHDLQQKPQVGSKENPRCERGVIHPPIARPMRNQIQIGLLLFMFDQDEPVIGNNLVKGRRLFTQKQSRELLPQVE